MKETIISDVPVGQKGRRVMPSAMLRKAEQGDCIKIECRNIGSYRSAAKRLKMKYKTLKQPGGFYYLWVL